MKTFYTYVIVEDHTLFRKGFVKLIESQVPSLHLLFEAGNGAEFIQNIEHYGLPDIVILDIKMPVMDGFATVQWIKQHYPDLPIIILTMFDDDLVFRRMVGLGVKGIIYKSTSGEALDLALKAILSNKTYFSEPNLNGEVEYYIESKPLELLKTLSLQEQKFLELACQEFTIEQIADKMNLSSKTIEKYRLDVYEKFGVHSRTGLLRYAIRNNLVRITS